MLLCLIRLSLYFDANICKIAECTKLSRKIFCDDPNMKNSI